MLLAGNVAARHERAPWGPAESTSSRGEISSAPAMAGSNQTRPASGALTATSAGRTWRQDWEEPPELASAPNLGWSASTNMVYDEATRQVVLFGGFSQAFGAIDGTWLWYGQRWHRYRGAGPPARDYQSMVYDGARHQVLVFGGSTSCECAAGYLGDTWTWSGARWTPHSGAGPGPRWQAYIAYDAATRQVVLFGGEACANNGVLGLGVHVPDYPDNYQCAELHDTWTWDGSRWTRRDDGRAGPPARRYGSMAYDPATGQVVLVGGCCDSRSQLYRDTWIWSGRRWTRIATELPGRVNGSLVFDPVAPTPGGRLGGLIVFGGDNGAYPPVYLSDLWTWNGRSWIQGRSGVGAGLGPGPRSRAGMVYDAAIRRVVLFGGLNGGGALHDAWGWDGRSWGRLSSLGPEGRALPDLVYLPANGTVLLFGGLGSRYPFETLGDTWTWSGSWTVRSGPSSRSGEGLAYDPLTGQVVMFGGCDAGCGWGVAAGDTWTWKDGRWSRRSGTSPPARTQPAMVWDAATRQVVLFGGHTFDARANNLPLADTWVWNGSGWRQVGGNHPPALLGWQAVYDAASRQLVLFHGGSSSALSQTWLWDGRGWKQYSGSGPTARTLYSLAYDPATRQVVLFGGTSAQYGGPLNDTWTWNGSAWTQTRVGLPVGDPSARGQAAMSYDSASRQLILFGGDNYATAWATGYPPDTWSWNGSQWTQVTTSGPSGRLSPSLVDDPATARLLLVGGAPQSNAPARDSWIWNGAHWSQIPGGGPSPLEGTGSIVYSGASQRVILFSPDRAVWSW